MKFKTILGSLLLLGSSLVCAQTKRTLMENLSASNTSFYLNTSTQKLGIGTSSPSERLDVQGNIKSTGTIIAPQGTIDNLIVIIGTASNITISNTVKASTVNVTGRYQINGSNVLAIPPGGQNIAVGVNAGTSTTTGARNTFVGQTAGALNTTGTDNTFLGASAGIANISGVNNTFVGKRSGYTNSTGLSNTFVGNECGYYTTTGTINTFVGYQAGYNNIAGIGNNFIGVAAGHENTLGNSNSFLGYWTGYYNTEGYENTFLGNTAGYKNTIGYQNVAVGKLAGFSNVNGYRNTFLGVYAGYYSLGSSNTFVGNFAGFRNTTGSNNIAIGAYADFVSTTSSNRLNIGNVVYGDLLSGNIGIGTISPTEKFEVNGNIKADFGVITSTLTVGSTNDFPTDSLTIPLSIEGSATNIYGLGIRNNNSGFGAMSGLVLGNDLTANAALFGLSNSSGGPGGMPPNLTFINALSTMAFIAGGANSLIAFNANTASFSGMVTASTFVATESAFIVGDTIIQSEEAFFNGNVTAGHFYGDGSGLSNAGDNLGNHLAGQVLNLNNFGLINVASETITGNSFSVGDSTFAVKNGKVGIGTSNPTTTLQVNGSIYSSNYIQTGNSLRAPFWLGESFYWRNSDNSIRWMDLKTGGNVGINTSNPSEKLEVVGNIKSDFGIIASTGVFSSSVTASSFFGDGSHLTGISAGDNFGNHVATMTVDMAQNYIVNATTITGVSIPDSYIGSSKIIFYPAYKEQPYENYYYGGSLLLQAGDSRGIEEMAFGEGGNITLKAGNVDTNFGYEYGGSVRIFAGTTPAYRGQQNGNIEFYTDNELILSIGGGVDYEAKRRLVGIGTGVPSEKLEVVGNIKSDFGIIASTGVFSSSVTASSFFGDGSNLTGIPPDPLSIDTIQPRTVGYIQATSTFVVPSLGFGTPASNLSYQWGTFHFKDAQYTQQISIAGGFSLCTNTGADGNGTWYPCIQTNGQDWDLQVFDGATNHDFYFKSDGNAEFPGNITANFDISAATGNFVNATLSGPATGYALCVNAENKITTCASAVGADGGCTCP